MPLSEKGKKLLDDTFRRTRKFEVVWYYRNPKGSGFINKKKEVNKNEVK